MKIKACVRFEDWNSGATNKSQVFDLPVWNLKKIIKEEEQTTKTHAYLCKVDSKLDFLENPSVFELNSLVRAINKFEKNFRPLELKELERIAEYAGMKEDNFLTPYTNVKRMTTMLNSAQIVDNSIASKRIFIGYKANKTTSCGMYLTLD